MGISVADNFNYQGQKPLDSRTTYATVAAMKAAADSSLYDGLTAYVSENQKRYEYKSSNTVDPTTGKWREYKTSGVPDGGTTGQVLKKRSDADGDVEWADDSGGGAGRVFENPFFVTVRVPKPSSKTITKFIDETLASIMVLNVIPTE